MAIEFEKVRGGGAILSPPPPFIEVDTFLFVVDFVFTPTKSQYSILTGIRGDMPPVRVGQALHLLAPDGQETSTYIAGFPMIRHGDNLMSISVPGLIKEENVPVGTQVWAVKGSSERS